jgi:branched-subunit amino acid aminotransferase/4-amino-4-deoxychorismate lyase
MDFKFFSKNGKILPIEQAVVPLSNIEYAYGFGVYDNLRVINGLAYFLEDHIDRLINSAKIIGISHSFDAAFIKNSILDLVKKTKSKTYNFKILLVGDSLYIFCLNPLFPDKKLYQEGAKFITYHYERLFPNAKTLNMLQSYLAFKKAKESGCYDSLLINQKEYITEGTRTNFFYIKDKMIYSPLEKDILPGVMRKAMLKVAAKNNYQIIEKNIKLEDIKSYDGAFVTSTSSKIIPIRSIDSHLLKPIPESLKKLMALLNEFLRSCGGEM